MNIVRLVIIDFDGTLFRTPLPNELLWTRRSIGVLKDINHIRSGGWYVAVCIKFRWHDVRPLKAVGMGFEKELAAQWQSHWNESMVLRLNLKLGVYV